MPADRHPMAEGERAPSERRSRDIPTFDGSPMVRAWSASNGLAGSGVVFVECANGSRHYWLSGVTKERADEVAARLAQRFGLKTEPPSALGRGE